MKQNLYPDKGRIETLKKLCGTLEITLNDYGLLNQALTHSSYAHELKDAAYPHNERLEFLGDSILNLIISRHLFLEYPDLSEGELSFARSQIVCEQTLALRASNLNLGDYLLLSKGVSISSGRERISILADAFEAVLAAIFLGAGFEAASKYVLDNLKDDIRRAQHSNYNNSFIKDYKSWLQETIQKNGSSKISYELVTEQGPAHDRLFQMAVVVKDRRMGLGWGKSKKEAEQQAARQALIKLEILVD